MNYYELVAAAKAYADRQDLEVSDNMDIFIVMVESKVNRLLKTRKQTKRAYTPTQESQSYYSLPPDYAGMRDIQLNSALPTTTHSVQQLNYITPEQFNRISQTPYAGVCYYTVIANQIQIFPTQEVGLSIEMVYYQKVPNLNAYLPLPNEPPFPYTNWLSEDHPDIYLSGMISEIESFVKNYEVAKVWSDRMKLAVNDLETSDVAERWAGQSLSMRVE